MNKYQIFAAPEGVITKADVQVKAREVDFVTSFASDVQSLLDVMGISRMIEKQNGTKLTHKKVTGMLNPVNAGEGEEIPYSHYNVEEVDIESIEFIKRRKGVSAEAITEKGYAAAVADTDEEFKNDLRDIVIDKFYAGLNGGLLTSNEDTFQKAIAMAIGRVRAKFKAMRKGISGVAVWVNELDLYEYLGDANITLQTAFGQTYIQNFLGATTMFVSTEVERGKVIATPINNLVAYYINPANSELAQAGLSYTADSETGFIGMHVEGNYGRALGEAFAVLGLRIFAEYLDGIAVITFAGGSAVKVEAETATILGKNPADLQSNVVVNAGRVTGALKYVENFDAFETGAEGNFLALKFVHNADSVQVGLVPSMGRGMITLDSDNNAVLQIADAEAQALKVVATTNNVETTDYYELDKLFCEKKAIAEV